MAKQKLCVSVSHGVLDRMITFQKHHHISHLSSVVEALISMALDEADLVSRLDELRQIQTELSRRQLTILTGLSLQMEIPSETKTMAAANADQIVQKVLANVRDRDHTGEE